jgi:hypothetical protein
MDVDGVYQELCLRAQESGALSDSPASPLYSCRMQTNSYSTPKKSFIAHAFVLMCAISISGFLSGCDGGKYLKGVEAVAEAQETSRSPFSLSIVPGIGGITMAKNKPREFYVVITNVSGGPQSIWQYWNSWGYQAISFELTTADGKKFVLSALHKNSKRPAF